MSMFELNEACCYRSGEDHTEKEGRGRSDRKWQTL